MRMAELDVPKVKCAIYTRKSNENGLELQYNSLHAQYDQALAFINGRKDMGWEVIDKHYDDGGFTGANMNRPALQELFEDIKQGRVDIVVAYRYDRLTRSFMDFARILELLGKYKVGFVSVTEPIDTSSSIGKFIPGILIMIAQCERENTARRISDKMIATKRKGYFCGGNPPYGYKLVDKLLVEIPERMDIVRWIFKRYQEIGSPFHIAKQLNFEGRLRPNGDRWVPGRINDILVNPVYAGMIPIKKTKELCKGLQEPIIPFDEWKRIQESRKHSSGRKRSMTYVALRGRVICSHCGCVMPPVYSIQKENRRYTYFKCMRGWRQAGEDCPIRCIPERVVNKVVSVALAKFMSRESFIKLLAKGDRNKVRFYEMVAKDPDVFAATWLQSELGRFAELLVDSVVVHIDGIEINFRNIEGAERDALKDFKVFKRLELQARRIYVIESKDGWQDRTFVQPTPIIRTLAKAHKWVELIASGTYDSASALAKTLGCNSGTLFRDMHLPFLSPVIIEQLVRGQLKDLAVGNVMDHWSLLWEDQERALCARGEKPLDIPTVPKKEPKAIPEVDYEPEIDMIEVDVEKA